VHYDTTTLLSLAWPVGGTHCLHACLPDDATAMRARARCLCVACLPIWLPNLLGPPAPGTHMMPTTPWVLQQTAEEPVHHSPLFGQHCAEVLAEELSIVRKQNLRILLYCTVMLLQVVH
jgi:hypothetical protein